MDKEIRSDLLAHVILVLSLIFIAACSPGEDSGGSFTNGNVSTMVDSEKESSQIDISIDPAFNRSNESGSDDPSLDTTDRVVNSVRVTSSHIDFSRVEATRVCVANATEPCNCIEGSGSRRCLPDGSGWPACVCSVQGVEFAVSPTGNDAASGSRASPFRSLQRARQAVRAALADGVPKGGITVWMYGGVYELEQTLTLGPEDSGTPADPIVWRSVPGQTAIISGGKVLHPDLFSPVPLSSEVRARFQPAVRDRIVHVDLPAIGITNFGELEKRGYCRTVTQSPAELFIDGARATLARWPNVSEDTLAGSPETSNAVRVHGVLNPDVTGRYVKTGVSDGVSAFKREGLVNGRQYYLYRMTWTFSGTRLTAWFLNTQSSGYPMNNDPRWERYEPTLGEFTARRGASGIATTTPPEAINQGLASIAEVISSTQWRFAGSRPLGWMKADGIRLHGFWKHSWADCHLGLSKVDPATRTITLDQSPGSSLKAGQPWYAYNLPEELDEPGEWWLDRARGSLYLLPPAGFHQSHVTLSQLQTPLLRLKNSSSIVLQDLTLEAGRSRLVEIDSGHGNALVGLVLRNAGTDAVLLSGSNHTVSECHFHDLGGSGIRASGGDRRTLSSSNHVISRSNFERFGQQDWVYRPAVSVDGVGIQVLNNRIHDAPHMGILINGNDHLIERNEIHDVCKFTSDAGAIYSGRDWGYRGNVIRHNFVHDIATYLHGFGVHGIYLDDCVSGFKVEGNILFRVSGHGILHGGGRDTIMKGNLIAQSGSGLSADSRCFDRSTIPNNVPGDSSNLLEKLNAVGYQSSVWRVRYPECAAIPNDWSIVSDKTKRWLHPEGSVFQANLGVNNTNLVSASAHTTDAYSSVAGNVAVSDFPFRGERYTSNELGYELPIDTWIPGFERIPFDRIGLSP